MTRVKLYAYDLTRGMARTMSTMLLGRQIDGVWHTGIVAYGREYFYGSHGISSVHPGTVLGRPTEIVDIGESQIPPEVFEEFLSQLGEERYSGLKYHLLEHNCNTFSNEVAYFLTGNINKDKDSNYTYSIPDHIFTLQTDLLTTPFWQAIRPTIDHWQRLVNIGQPYFRPQPPQQDDIDLD